MARAKRSSRKRPNKKGAGWLNHQSLVVSEAVLCVGLAQELLESWVLGLEQVPPMLRVLAGIGVVVGTLGGLMLWLRAHVERGLAETHSVITSRLPLPGILAHGLFVFGLFCAYAWLWDDQTGALGALWRLMESPL